MQTGQTTPPNEAASKRRPLHLAPLSVSRRSSAVVLPAENRGAPSRPSIPGLTHAARTCGRRAIPGGHGSNDRTPDNHVIVDAEGWAHSNALHSGHFPSLLWEMLRGFDYTEPPQYSGHESILMGTERCQMIVKIPACPARLDWGSWQLTVFGRRPADSWEIAARKAIEEFSEKHNAEIMETPYIVFPLKDETTQAWTDRVNRNLNYMMPDYNAKTAASFRYSLALLKMYEQLREENVMCRSQV
ncbi:uncharacterized protein C2845_PM11G21980 [Panicum miliaceum]|uniref:Uncharacterized protein n=1 Tax=Panicum miliaceum TaxID=4540 RepID=A0A3L6RTF7_PANMI|nr:uncharacterized protein C2845_PM11G21980 [Panicum miliaceum]